jgi:serine/threonine protein kinase
MATRHFAFVANNFNEGIYIYISEAHGTELIASELTVETFETLYTVEKCLTHFDNPKMDQTAGNRRETVSSIGHYRGNCVCTPETGNICYYIEQHIGSSLSGSAIFKGSFWSAIGHPIKCAVKKISVSSDTVGYPKDSEVLRPHHSPNLIRFYGYKADLDFHYFAFELGEMDLFGYVASEMRLAGNETLRSLGFGICAGIKYLHDNQMLHRNLTPAKVLICYADGNKPVPKLSNFGIHRSFTPIRALSSIQNWMAPESSIYSDYIHTFHTTKDSDMFSLGCVLYYLLSRGGHPFFDNDPTFILHHIKEGHRSKHSNAAHNSLTDALLRANPWERLTIEQTMCNPFFAGLRSH